MIYGLRALITRRGNVVRSDIARPETVARYLARAGVIAPFPPSYATNGRC